MNNSTTTEARVKIRTDLESLEFWEIFNTGFAKLRNNQI
jgi:hypothetical protein